MQMNPGNIEPPLILDYATPLVVGSELRKVAARQRAVIICILVQIVLVFVMIFLPAVLMPLSSSGLSLEIVKDLQAGLCLVFLAVEITGAIFVFMLAILLYGTGVGILLGFLALVPCFGAVVLLIVTWKANRFLREHGIRVGFLGVNPKTFLTGDSFPPTSVQ